MADKKQSAPTDRWMVNKVSRLIRTPAEAEEERAGGASTTPILQHREMVNKRAACVTIQPNKV
ncbi:MAG: hypothetical protein ACLFU8_02810 [Anaerolineales bacterium]